MSPAHRVHPVAYDLVGHILERSQRRPGAFGLEAKGHSAGGDVGIAYPKNGDIALNFPLLPTGALLETWVMKVRPLGSRAYAAAVVSSLALDAGLKYWLSLSL